MCAVATQSACVQGMYSGAGAPIEGRAQADLTFRAANRALMSPRLAMAAFALSAAADPAMLAAVPECAAGGADNGTPLLPFVLEMLGVALSHRPRLRGLGASPSAPDMLRGSKLQRSQLALAANLLIHLVLHESHCTADRELQSQGSEKSGM